MNKTILEFDGVRIETYSVSTLVVGSGAAGFKAALELCKQGQTDIALVTEGIHTGTSRNTGSDKQTYYKLTLSGSLPDSPAAMASDLFSGRCVDGDVALVEAAMSAQCFLTLCDLGVPFPVNRYGEFVGYKTDHDPRTRATSAGPLTSKMMTEQLEKAVAENNVPLFDGYMVIAVITENEEVAGILALNKNKPDDENTRFTLFNCKNIVYATGGPAGIYKDSVYPACHSGSSGIAFEAGVRGKNLTEWQYGLASTHPRWNVSGTYMQVLPRFVSVDESGTEREFLSDYFDSPEECLSRVFEKGYEWPFDCRKAVSGSSVIDLLVYREQILLNRKVFLDFRSNPFLQKELDFSSLRSGAREYLSQAECCFGTPIERLLHMNAPAYELYLSKGVDLKQQMLEISLCAQHNNGGLGIDLWWQTNIKGFFAAGEVAGSHGVYRPGGSALNAGQVGALRAAQYIAGKRPQQPPCVQSFHQVASGEVFKHIQLTRAALKGKSTAAAARLKEVTTQMSAAGGAIRDLAKIEQQLDKIKSFLLTFEKETAVEAPKSLTTFYRLRDILISQFVYLSAMKDYIENGGKSRGSALYVSEQGEAPKGLDSTFKFMLDKNELDEMVQEISYRNGECTALWRPVRPLPESGGFFENVWREYRACKNIF